MKKIIEAIWTIIITIISLAPIGALGYMLGIKLLEQ